MARLPVPGGDDDNWGFILNDFLQAGHLSDGLHDYATLASNMLKAGTLVSRPAASSANNNTYYFVTDVQGGTLYRSNGTSWDQITRGMSASPVAHAVTHASAGTDPVTPMAIGAVPATSIGAASGVASLDTNTKVPTAQLPDLSATYVPVAQKGAANGVATLDSSGKVPTSQIPTSSTTASNQSNEILLVSSLIIYGNGTGSGNANQATGLTYKASFITATAGTNLRIYLPAWFYTGDAAETGVNQPISYKASLEYNGKIYPISFGGSRTMVTEAWGTAISTPLGLNLPKGVQAAVRVMIKTSTSAGQFPQGAALGGPDVTVTGDGFNNGDNVDAVTFTPSQTNIALWSPVAITCTRTGPVTNSWLAVGDSITAGQGDSSTYSFSWFTRAINNQVPAIRLAGPSDTAQQYGTLSRAHALSYAAYCSHGIVFIGTNDIVVKSRTALQVETDVISGICSPLADQGLKMYVGTLIPRNTSTNSWATLANQTPTASESVRVAYNTWVRAGLPLNPTTKAPVSVGTSGALMAGSVGHPVIGYVEIADTVESAQNSGKWKVTGVANAYTADGVHPNAAGASLMAGALSPIIAA